MSLLYIALAVLAALDSSLAGLNVLPWFNALRWLRIHLITLGTLTEVIFAVLPGLVAERTGQPRPKTRWDIWLTLNAGLLILLIGIPLVNAALIFTGGTLVFIAAMLLIAQLNGLRTTTTTSTLTGRRFYLAGLSYLLLGIIVGTGLWLGWGAALRIAVPIEVHIHANNWGFMSLVFAGLLVDLSASFTQRPLAWPRSIKPIFWMMTSGALLLVLGPWLKNEALSVPGIVLHLSATGWLLMNVIKPVWADRRKWSPGLWHILTGYVWIIAPVLVAPLIILKVPGFPGAGIEQNAPQALIYGWVLQFGYALVPYLFARFFLPDQPARPGGNWFSLITVHAGGVLLWASIFAGDAQPALHAMAYAFWAASLVPIVLDLWRIAREGLGRFEHARVESITDDPAGAN